jgi:hypothetical protein
MGKELKNDVARLVGHPGVGERLRLLGGHTIVGQPWVYILQDPCSQETCSMIRIDPIPQIQTPGSQSCAGMGFPTVLSPPNLGSALFARRVC